MTIDVHFDFQAESGGRDSDKYSPTLQEYHRILWSKPLPVGGTFELTKISVNRLHHRSNLGEFTLSSDRAVATFSRWKSTIQLIAQIPTEQLSTFVRFCDTMGSIIIWPSTQIKGLPTINAARGFNRKIADRLDLTIECIRRYYLGQESPLYETFLRYEDFFGLFENFNGYIDFFLLQDAVTADYSAVNISVPLDNFESSPIPRNKNEYREYMETTTSFIEARNRRIANYVKQILPSN